MERLWKMPANSLLFLVLMTSLIIGAGCKPRTPVPDEPSVVGTPPTILEISPQSVDEDTALSFDFVVEDPDETLNCATQITFLSAAPDLIDPATISFSGDAPNCRMSFSGFANQNGVTSVTLQVKDSNELVSERQFEVTINAIADAPVITALSNRTLRTDETLSFNLLVQDPDAAMDCASTISVSSSNVGVLPSGDVGVSGTTPTCIVFISPSLNVAGTTELTFTANDGVLSDSESFNLELFSLQSIVASPSVLSLAVGGSSNLQLVANYSNGPVVSRATLASWSSSDSASVSVDNGTSKGLVQGLAAGTSVIQATYEGLTANATINAYVITGIGVSRGAVTGGIGSQTIVSATAQTTTSSFDITNSASWVSSDSSVATASNGVIQLLSAGTATIQISYGSFSAAVNVIVQAKSLTSISLEITGGGSSIPLNGIKKMKALANYSDLSSEDVTNLVSWTTSNSSFVAIETAAPYQGNVIGMAVGDSTITATIGAVSAQMLVTVNSVSIVSIAVSPSDALVVSNASYKLVATATYSDATTADVTQLATWSSSSTSAATVSNAAGLRGLVSTPSFTGYRSTVISAVLSGVTGSTPMGVNGATITSIVVTPDHTLTVAQSEQARAYANLSDGGLIDVTDFSIWSSSQPGVVSVSNSIGSIGLITGVSNGTASVTASFAGQSGSRNISVDTVPSSAEIGLGLLANYYTWSASPVFSEVNRRGSRIDSKINFSWGVGNAPMGVGERYLVRWSGFYKATDSANYFCTYSDDGIRVWINGSLVINQWNDHAGRWDCSGLINLSPGVKYSVVVEFFENGGFAEAHLTQSAVSAVDAQNTATRAVPQSKLFPN